MGDRQLWTFINSFADWLSALGTIGAVIVALYLARKDARITLRVVSGLRVIVERGAPERHDEHFMLEVESPRGRLGQAPGRHRRRHAQVLTCGPRSWRTRLQGDAHPA